MLIAEALLLLVLDEDKGTATWVTAADQGLAGALLLDLDVREEDGRLVVDGTRPSEPALAAAWDVVSAERRPARQWVSKLPGRLKPIKGTIAASLVERGVLDKQRHRSLGVFKSVRYPELDPAPERELRARLRRVLVEGAEPDAFDVSLLGLLVPLDLVKRVVGRDERKAAKARAKEIAQRGPVGDAVKAAVQEQVMAAVIATTAATAATTAGS
jgi:hypothetical protein